LHDAGFKRDNAFVQGSAERTGLCCSNAYGSLEAIVELDRVAVFEDARYINPAKFPNTVANSAAGYVSIWEDLRALNVAVSDGNCGALDTVACADVFLESGRADALLVGGGEAMSEPLFVAFRSLGALGPLARLGEAAVLFAMEPTEHAQARGARVLAEVTGYGTAFVPPAGESPLIHASKEALERACRAALEDAGIEAKDVDIIASGVSGLRTFDEAETEALAAVFGKDAPVAAPKHVFGETLGAGGGMGMASALAWLEGGAPRPMISGRAPTSPRIALVTSMGFYGNASAVVLRRPTIA
jgi:3-oxoacyl-[acyl-carrier-protein] synthase II